MYCFLLVQILFYQGIKSTEPKKKVNIEVENKCTIILDGIVIDGSKQVVKVKVVPGDKMPKTINLRNSDKENPESWNLVESFTEYAEKSVKRISVKNNVIEIEMPTSKESLKKKYWTIEGVYDDTSSKFTETFILNDKGEFEKINAKCYGKIIMIGFGIFLIVALVLGIIIKVMK